MDNQNLAQNATVIAHMVTQPISISNKNHADTTMRTSGADIKQKVYQHDISVGKIRETT